MMGRTQRAGQNSLLVLGAWTLLYLGAAAQAQDAGGAATTGQTSTSTTSATTTAAGDAALQKTLQETYNKCVAATKKRDESVLAGVRSRDFVYKEANGKTYTRDQVEDGERRALAQVQTITSVSSRIDSVTQAGGKATVSVRQSFVGTVVDAQNKAHVMNMTTTTRDTWTQGKDGWKLQSVYVVGHQDTRDGKAFDPAAAPTTANNQNPTGNNANNNGNRNRGNYSGYHAPTYHIPHISTPKLPRTGRHSGKV